MLVSSVKCLLTLKVIEEITCKKINEEIKEERR